MCYPIYTNYSFLLRMNKTPLYEYDEINDILNRDDVRPHDVRYFQQAFKNI